MLLAELSVWHNRPRTPTRRVALGHLVLPLEPAPGFGGLLLGAVVATHLAEVDGELLPDLHRLVEQIHRGERIVQPRLFHRFQTDRHGLARSVHRMEGDGEELSLSFETTGSPLAQVLGALYAVERLAVEARPALIAVLRRALVWRGAAGPELIAHLADAQAVSMSVLMDPRVWALEVLGFPPGTTSPSRQDVLARFRRRLREVHPDHGGDHSSAHSEIGDLGAARRILTSG